MKIVELLKISRDLLKVLSHNGSIQNDWKYIDLYEEYSEKKLNRIKVRSIADELAKKYDLNISSVFRIVKRLGKDVDLNC